MLQRFFYFLVVWVLGDYEEANGQKNTLKGEFSSSSMVKSGKFSSTFLTHHQYLSPFSGFRSNSRESRHNYYKIGINIKPNLHTLDKTYLPRPGYHISRNLDMRSIPAPDVLQAKLPVMHPVLQLRDISTAPITSYFDQLGFFCKKEIQLDRLTPLPVRVRLGSLEYVNWLEQKPNSRQF